VYTLSLITVCFNSEKTIEETILSVIEQDLDNFEYIIIDGQSIDNTMSIIKKYSNYIDLIVSEKDSGIYDAINKGIKMSNGNIIGILNSDDILYTKSVLSTILNKFSSNRKLDSIIADIKFVNQKGQLHRYYSSSKWKPKNLEWGLMPPHPSFYCKRELFEKYGYYRNDLKIAADYELLIRFYLVNRISYEYIPAILVQMRLGGISTANIFSKININKEVLYAFKLNNLNNNFLKIYTKYLFKIFEYF
jgi:glycosyltransferase involved in cell wall biosynthesis